jgi:hypothetical protein
MEPDSGLRIRLSDSVLKDSVPIPTRAIAGHPHFSAARMQSPWIKNACIPQTVRDYILGNPGLSMKVLRLRYGAVSNSRSRK